jgi:hypothetical protein
MWRNEAKQWYEGNKNVGAWRSLVAHLLWEQGAGGSNPLAPTNKTNLQPLDWLSLVGNDVITVSLFIGVAQSSHKIRLQTDLTFAGLRSPDGDLVGFPAHITEFQLQQFRFAWSASGVVFNIKRPSAMVGSMRHDCLQFVNC